MPWLYAYAPPRLGLQRAGGRVVGLPGVVGEDPVAGVKEDAVFSVKAVLPLQLPLHRNAIVPQHRRPAVPAGGTSGARFPILCPPTGRRRRRC